MLLLCIYLFGLGNLKYPYLHSAAKAKTKIYEHLYAKLETNERVKDLYRLARQRHRAEEGIVQVKLIKDSHKGI